MDKPTKKDYSAPIEIVQAYALNRYSTAYSSFITLLTLANTGGIIYAFTGLEHIKNVLSTILLIIAFFLFILSVVCLLIGLYKDLEARLKDVRLAHGKEQDTQEKIIVTADKYIHYAYYLVLIGIFFSAISVLIDYLIKFTC